MGIIRKTGFDFGFDPNVCQYCPGYCCCGEHGYVWVNQSEILAICRFMGINPIDGLRNYIDKIDNRFSLKERHTENGFECIFFDAGRKRCAVYEVRPIQCRRYPFWDEYKKNSKQVMRECPGIIPHG